MSSSEFKVFDARIKNSFGMLVSGPPYSGKTYFVLQLLRHSDRLIDTKFDNIVFFYGQYNSAVEQIKSEHPNIVTVVEGIPDNIDDYIAEKKQNLFIFDDLMQEATSNRTLTSLFYKKCQHQQVSWIMLVQNIFHYGKERLTFYRCAHYLVLFYNSLDKSQIYSIAQKILPGQQKSFIKMYEMSAGLSPHGYLMIYGDVNTPAEARFRTDIFNSYQRVFVLQK
jgi:hypothetical protein